MSNVNIFLIVALVFVALIVIEACSGINHPFRKTFFNSLLGVLTMFIVNICSVFTGISLPTSILSLCISSLLGIPGVATMVIMSSIIAT